MRHRPRKTTPKVKDGKVQRKNRSARTPTYWNTPQRYPVLDKEKPGRGYKHLVRKRELHTFINIVPEWEQLSVGLDAVLLARHEYNTMGWHDPGVVAVCAWDRHIEWHDASEAFCREHAALLQKLQVDFYPWEEKDGDWFIGFTESTAKAFQLIHVLVHELGHHHDRMTTRSRRRAARGEGFAEFYARRWEDTIIERYFEVFGLP